ncbi:response regulator transcription factor [Saprospiraceae bacterium]|nr:response regulator transcription factor [Saprospiraceae bacterium]
MNIPKKILLVEDDTSLGFLLMEYLEGEGFEVKLCRDGVSGLQNFRRSAFDLCILDVMMPKLDGFTVAEKIHASNPDLPFLFLTAKLLKADRLKGFSVGAQDYITKPFDEEELVCRINVILKRAKNAAQLEASLPTKFNIGDFQFDYNRQELASENQVFQITEKENEVLRLLCLHKNRILRRDDAVEKIYGKKDYFLGRSFDVFISRLRKLLKTDDNVSIDNVFKVGFILNVKEGITTESTSESKN